MISKELKFLILCLFFLFTAISGSFISLPVGELKGQSWVLFLPLLMIILIFNRYIAIPKSYLRFFCLFSIIVLISGVANFTEIYNTIFKGRSGIERFFGQYMLFVIMACTSFSLFNIKIDLFNTANAERSMLKLVYISSVPVFFIGFFELLWVVFDVPVESLLLNISMLFRDEEYLNYISTRARGSLFEAPALGMYLSFLLPFLFLIRNSFTRFLVIFLLFCLVYASSSRVALVLCILGALLYLLMKDRYSLLILLAIIPIIVILASFGLLDSISEYMFSKLGAVFSIEQDVQDDFHAVSNLTRLASQNALFSMFLEKPILGWGLGQATLHIDAFYPSWGYASYEVGEYASNTLGTQLPPLYSLWMRMIVELGIAGFLTILTGLAYLYRKINGIEFITLNMKGALKVSYLLTILSLLQFDSYRVIQFWIVVSVILFFDMLNEKNKNNTIN